MFIQATSGPREPTEVDTAPTWVGPVGVVRADEQGQREGRGQVWRGRTSSERPRGQPTPSGHRWERGRDTQGADEDVPRSGQQVKCLFETFLFNCELILLKVRLNCRVVEGWHLSRVSIGDVFKAETLSTVTCDHQHISKIECWMSRTACLVCLISTVNSRKKEPWKNGISSGHITNLKQIYFCLLICMPVTVTLVLALAARHG